MKEKFVGGTTATRAAQEEASMNNYVKNKEKHDL
jgi:hypothetical protein